MGLEYDSLHRPHSIENVNVIKCALLGDGMSGKTCMLHSYMKDVFIHKYTATISDKYRVQMLVGDEQTILDVRDTAGQNDFEAFRAHTYTESDVLILCFSVCDVESFSNILHFWLPEMKQYTKRKIPIILVGTHTDMRSSVQNTHVTTEQGHRLAKLIGAEMYVECSAKTRSGLNNVFDNVFDSAPKRKKRRNSFLRRLFHRQSIS